MADRIQSYRPVTTPRSPRDPRQFVTALIGAIPKPPPSLTQSLNPLKDDIPRAKNIFLALHVIFPNELLPALDVLDRGLVVRLRTSQRSSTHLPLPALLLVRSAQQRSRNTRNPAADHVAYYEVRLDAWNCSCPTFIFSAFSERQPEITGDDDARNAVTSAEGLISEEVPNVDEHTSGFQFGGCSRNHDLPICKHLLACLLVENCSAFEHFVEEREVSEGEMAGWAAGWGD